MANNLINRIKAGINILNSKETWIAVEPEQRIYSGRTSVMARPRPIYDTQASVLEPIVNRISIDVSAIPIRHARVNTFEQYQGIINSELDFRLSIRANMDQSGTAFIKDAVEIMLDEGAVAIVPVEITSNPNTGTFEILSLRAASILEWYNGSIKVSIYNEVLGIRVEKEVSKAYAAIAYNPLNRVMNEPNSTLRRLVDRLSLLDVADGKQFSPGLDIIIQLPYTLKNERRVAEAERRIASIQEQLENSSYGIAYVDSNERIIQLNRPVSNTLFETVKSLQETLHAQLGMSPAIFSGNPTPEELIYYHNRTISPIVKALADAMTASFISRTAYTQGHRVMGIPTNLLKMATVSELSTVADTLSRNAIMTSNEFRSLLGLPPSGDTEADELRNKNLNKPAESEPPPTLETPNVPAETQGVETYDTGQ